MIRNRKPRARVRRNSNKVSVGGAVALAMLLFAVYISVLLVIVFAVVSVVKAAWG